MGEVVMFDGHTVLDLPPDRVIEAAMGRLSMCLVIGTTHEGDTWLATSIGDIEKAIFQLERAKHHLMHALDNTP